MANFASLHESIRAYKEENRNRKEEEALDLISRGIDIGGEDFWDNFLRIIGDGRGFSAILDINQQKIATWRSKIRKYLDKYNVTEDEDFDERPKKRRLVTPDDHWEDME